MARKRKYPDELLARGARLVFESGRPIAHAARVADEGEAASCCGPGAVLSDEEARVFGAGLYSEEAQGELPDTATMAARLRQPTAVAEFEAGETAVHRHTGPAIVRARKPCDAPS